MLKYICVPDMKVVSRCSIWNLNLLNTGDINSKLINLLNGTWNFTNISSSKSVSDGEPNVIQFTSSNHVWYTSITQTANRGRASMIATPITDDAIQRIVWDGKTISHGLSYESFYVISLDRTQKENCVWCTYERKCLSGIHCVGCTYERKRLGLYNFQWWLAWSHTSSFYPTCVTGGPITDSFWVVWDGPPPSAHTGNATV